MHRGRERFTPIYNKNSDFNTNAPSYYEYLAKLNEQLKVISSRIDDYDGILAENLEKHQQEINELIKRVEDEMDKIRSGGYLEQLYLDSLENWINTNLEEIVTRIAKFVWFGLTDDGYFMAVIPESWEDIEFNTTDDGHLTLTY